MRMKKAKGTKVIRGKLTISKPSGGPPGIYADMVHIRVEDALSTGIIMDIEIPLVEFGRAIFTVAYRPCEVRVFKGAIKRLGLKLETREDFLPCGSGPRGLRTFPTEETIKPYEVEGWIADRHDRAPGAFNSHRCGAGRDANGRQIDVYKVLFRRWVKPPRRDSDHVRRLGADRPEDSVREP
jgi:hypothetical protein